MLKIVLYCIVYGCTVQLFRVYTLSRTVAFGERSRTFVARNYFCSDFFEGKFFFFVFAVAVCCGNYFLLICFFYLCFCVVLTVPKAV